MRDLCRRDSLAAFLVLSIVGLSSMSAVRPPVLARGSVGGPGGGTAGIGAEPAPVFLLLGQSNALGANAVAGLMASSPALAARQPGLRVWDSRARSPRWQEYEPGVNAAPDGADPTLFGPEVSMGPLLTRRHGGRPVHLLKVAFSSSSLAPAGGAAIEWNVSARQLYAETLRRYRAAAEALASEGRMAVPAGVFWIQGETDVALGRGTAHRFHLAELVRRLRVDLGRSELPFVIARLHDGYEPRHMPQVMLVRRAQEAIASADPAIVCVSTDRLELLRDRTHFSVAGTIELGRHLVAALDADPGHGQPWRSLVRVLTNAVHWR
jgi:hypothetical protein